MPRRSRTSISQRLLDVLLQSNIPPVFPLSSMTARIARTIASGIGLGRESYVQHKNHRDGQQSEETYAAATPASETNLYQDAKRVAYNLSASSGCLELTTGWSIAETLEQYLQNMRRNFFVFPRCWGFHFRFQCLWQMWL